MDGFTQESPKKPQNLHRSPPTFAPQYAPARTTVQNILYRSTKSILSHNESQYSPTYYKTSCYVIQTIFVSNAQNPWNLGE